MALEHAILVSLAERSASGYDLNRRFDASIGQFWSATHQQIYKVLGRMADAGLVSVDVVEQDGRPDKKMYAVTAAGLAELKRWTAEPTPADRHRNTFAVKLRALPFGDRDAIVADARSRREHHAARLAYYEESAAKFYPDPGALGPDELGAWLVLRGGIRTEQGALEWCDEILQALEER